MLKYNIGTNKISGNFFLLDFKKAKFTADTTLKKLQKYGIILREMNSYGIKNCLRLTIGNTKENQIFLKRMNHYSILREKRNNLCRTQAESFGCIF